MGPLWAMSNRDPFGTIFHCLDFGPELFKYPGRLLNFPPGLVLLFIKNLLYQIPDLLHLSQNMKDIHFSNLHLVLQPGILFLKVGLGFPKLVKSHLAQLQIDQDVGILDTVVLNGGLEIEDGALEV